MPFGYCFYSTTGVRVLLGYKIKIANYFITNCIAGCNIHSMIRPIFRTNWVVS